MEDDMEVEVEGPDGEIFLVPAREMTVTRRPIGRKRFVPQHGGYEPLPHPDWTFSVAIGGKWFAYPKR